MYVDTRRISSKVQLQERVKLLCCGQRRPWSPKMVLTSWLPAMSIAILSYFVYVVNWALHQLTLPRGLGMCVCVCVFTSESSKSPRPSTLLKQKRLFANPSDQSGSCCRSLLPCGPLMGYSIYAVLRMYICTLLCMIARGKAMEERFTDGL